MSSFEKNLSEGNVAKQLVLFSLPFLASNIIQSLYSVGGYADCRRFSGYNQHVRCESGKR